jgi:hypothetical protein
VLAGGTTYGPGSHLTAGDILTHASASPARDMGGGVPRCRSLYLLDEQEGLIIKLQEARGGPRFPARGGMAAAESHRCQPCSAAVRIPLMRGRITFSGWDCNQTQRLGFDLSSRAGEKRKGLCTISCENRIGIA